MRISWTFIFSASFLVFYLFRFCIVVKGDSINFKSEFQCQIDSKSCTKISVLILGCAICKYHTEIEIYNSQFLLFSVWGVNCGGLTTYESWRKMFIERPRLHFNGCYISKTTYVRNGENSFQDQFYRPWHVVEYYRYLR